MMGGTAPVVDATIVVSGVSNSAYDGARQISFPLVGVLGKHADSHPLNRRAKYSDAMA
jgi:hypothetical protein